MQQSRCTLLLPPRPWNPISARGVYPGGTTRQHEGEEQPQQTAPAPPLWGCARVPPRCFLACPTTRAMAPCG